MSRFRFTTETNGDGVYYDSFDLEDDVDEHVDIGLRLEELDELIEVLCGQRNRISRVQDARRKRNREDL